MAAQPAPNRWRGPLGTAAHRPSEEVKEMHRQKMVEQLLADVSIVEDNVVCESPKFIAKFLEEEGHARGNFIDSHGWLVSEAIPPLQIPEKLLKEIVKRYFSMKKQMMDRNRTK